MSGSLLILAFFGAGLGLARLGLIPRYFVEHDATLYVLWLLMGLVGLSIGSDRRLGEILRTLRPRVLLLPLATTVGTFAGVAAAQPFSSLQPCRLRPWARASPTTPFPPSSSPSTRARNWAPWPCSATSCAKS